MANASPRDTRAGFDIYRSAGGQVPLEELNEQLVEAGYGPVANRSYDHFRALLDAGYSRYVSINRFDVARASAPYENASAMGRYDYRTTDLGVKVVFAKGSRLLEASGRAVEVGEVGAMLRFSETEVIDGLKKLKPQPDNMVTVRYLEAGRTVAGRVIDVDLRSDPASVEIEYTRLISIAAIGVGDPLPTTEANFVLTGPGDQSQTLDVVNRRLFHFFELVEGLRSLVNEAGARQPSPVYAEPPVLRRLSVASPAVLALDVAQALTALFPHSLLAAALVAAAAIPGKRKEWYEGTGQKLDNVGKDLDNRAKAAALELTELTVKREQEESALRTEMITRLRAAFPATSIADEDAARVIDENVLPSLRALGELGISSLEPGDDPDDQAGASIE